MLPVRHNRKSIQIIINRAAAPWSRKWQQR